ncbi:MAG: SDR family NAD(P)-dependent oxidoreductase [Methylovirgula sp.]
MAAAGLIGFPGSGYYAATKFAVEGFSESLAEEVAPLGLHVLLVEPGPFRTDLGWPVLEAVTAFHR